MAFHIPSFVEFSRQLNYNLNTVLSGNLQFTIKQTRHTWQWPWTAGVCQYHLTHCMNLTYNGVITQLPIYDNVPLLLNSHHTLTGENKFNDNNSIISLQIGRQILRCKSTQVIKIDADIYRRGRISIDRPLNKNIERL